MPEFPTVLLETGQFARVPHLYGTNSDEVSTATERPSLRMSIVVFWVKY